MYIDVLGIPSVSDAVHEASRMLRIGIAHAMANGIDDDNATTEDHDRQQTKPESSQRKNANTTEKDPVSVYSALTKRVRRPIPTVPEPSPSRHPNTHQPDHSTLSATKTGVALRSWNATKKAGPSILSKRNRSSLANGTASPASGTLSVFQPGPKREKRSDVQSRDTIGSTASRTAENKPPVRNAAKTSQGSSERLSSVTSMKDEVKRHHASEKASVNSAAPRTSLGVANQSEAKATGSLAMKNTRAVPPIAESQKSSLKVTKTQQAVPNRMPRKVGLPPSWCQVSAKSFKRSSVPQPKSALSLLRKPGSSKPRSLPAAPRGSSALSSISALKRSAATAEPPKVGKLVSDNAGLIPLPSSTGQRVKYVPGSEIINGVRPNGYTVSIDGAVKPVVTFNPKPKLPHKLRQNSVEQLFEGWRDIKRLPEGEALARALREEQEMYARAASRADYRATVLTKLKNVRTAENKESK